MAQSGTAGWVFSASGGRWRAHGRRPPGVGSHRRRRLAFSPFTPGDLVVESPWAGGTGTLSQTAAIPSSWMNTPPPASWSGPFDADHLGVSPLAGPSRCGESGTAAYDGRDDARWGRQLPRQSRATTRPPAEARSPSDGRLQRCPGAVSTVDMNGNIDSTTAAANFATVQNFRSATATTGGGGATFFLSGNAITPRAPPVASPWRPMAPPRQRRSAIRGRATGGGSGEVIDYQGTLYVVSRMSHTGFTVGSMSPLPTGAGTVTPLPGFPAGAGDAAAPAPTPCFPGQAEPGRRRQSRHHLRHRRQPGPGPENGRSTRAGRALARGARADLIGVHIAQGNALVKGTDGERQRLHRLAVRHRRNSMLEAPPSLRQLLHGHRQHRLWRRTRRPGRWPTRPGFVRPSGVPSWDGARGRNRPRPAGHAGRPRGRGPSLLRGPAGPCRRRRNRRRWPGAAGAGSRVVTSRSTSAS